MLKWLLLALTICWCVGLYNRLMRLRARALDALGSVEKNLRSYTSLVDGQFPQEEGSYIPLDWAGLVAAVKQLDGQCRATRQVPLQAAPLASLAQTMEAIEREWNLLCAQPADLAGPPMPEATQKAMDQAQRKVRTARGGFNQIVALYNQALHQFPARVVVGLMGFTPAGYL
ncbi:MAG: LemA family protein [Rhodoferax sp.]|nr:LemA family protein [Rhodoferax sp.]